MDAARNDAKFGMQSLVKKVKILWPVLHQLLRSLNPFLLKTLGRNVATVIQSKEAVRFRQRDLARRLHPVPIF